MWRIINFIHRFGLIELFLISFVLVNALTFLLCYLDKRRAIQNRYRISEKTLIFFTVALGGLGALFGMYLLKHKTRKTQFKLTVAIGVIIAIIPVIHVVHGLTLDRIIQYVEIDFHAENWPAELDGYRIAFMTDFHTITDEDMAAVVRKLNGRSIDLLLLGGDFSADVFQGGNHYRGTIREISRAVTTDGIFGVEGNHDYYPQLFAAKEYYGIGILDNNGSQIRNGFSLVGVRDLWFGQANVEQALSDIDTDDFVLMVTHNPDVSMSQSSPDIDLYFAGHSHGGQITFFGFPMYLLLGSVSDYGLRFAHGFNYSAHGVPVFTSRGVGSYYNWPRIFARPEVVIFTMYSK